MSLVVVGLALALVAAWTVAAVVLPLWSAATAAHPPAARFSVLAAAIPVLAGLAVGVAAFVPGDPHLGQLMGCHCEASMPAWTHLCPTHPGKAASAVPWALGALALLLPGRLRGLVDLVRSSRARPGPAFELRDLPAPTAHIVGWLRPRVVADRAFWSSLSRPQRGAVLAHEGAHMARRDPLVLVVLSALLLPAPRPVARLVLRTWLNRAEERADAVAATEVGDALLVAETLLHCARLGAPMTARPAWMGGSLERRVRALAAQPQAPVSARPDPGLVDMAGFVGVAAALVVALPGVHHQVEHLINLHF
jgi:Zn-dependent protease with chaperone function